MKTASWSLALVAAAGSAFAKEEDCTDSSAPAYDPSSYVAAVGSSSAPAYAPSSYVAGYGSSSVPAGYPSGSIPAYPAGSSSSAYLPSYPVPSGSSYSAVVSSEIPHCLHVKTCAATSTLIYRSKTVYPVTTVLQTSCETSSVPASYPSASVPVAGSYPPNGPVIVTKTKTSTTTVCPCVDPTRTPGEVYTTETTSEYTSTCPGTGQTKTYTYGDWTSVYTSYDISTITDTYTVTITEPYPVNSDPAGYPSGSVPAYPSDPAGYPSGSVPAGYPSGSVPAGYPSGSAPAGYPSGSLPPYPIPSGTSSGGWSPTGTAPSYSTASACVPCQGQPGKDPKEWCGYTIHDNWYDVVPKTCVTHEYWWTITEETVSPDGISRPAFLVNSQMPGPMIEANWGDTIVVHLTNGLPLSAHNGTSLHFHGIRQNGTNEMDGVASITQCPIAPGSSMTYKWVANSYGTSWWHSHYSLQTYEGVFGPMIIHGPAAAEYDDEQMIMVQDWNHATVDSLFAPSQTVGIGTGPLTLDTGLINGMNTWNEGGQRFQMTVQSGKSYRLRLVNTAIQSTFVFYVDNHKFTVIAMDFVPIVPYETEKVVINIGQRYDLIMKADQPSADYWMRGDNQQPCGQLLNPNDIKGIVHYADGPMGEPTTVQYFYAPTCLDEPYESLVPIVPWNAGAQTVGIDESILIAPTGGNPNLFKWTLSGTTFYAEWEHPTLKQIIEDGTVPDVSGNLAIEVPNLGEWVYVIVESVIPLPHPIHLHGHDFLVLAQGLGVYNPGVALNLNNPPRRDVVNMPADPTTGTPGYVVIAFQTSNPGVWLLHCHIGWHNAMGFALQIIENLDGIANTVNYASQIEDTCSSWTNYANAYSVFAQPYDSGV